MAERFIERATSMQVKKSTLIKFRLIQTFLDKDTDDLMVEMMEAYKKEKKLKPIEV